MSSVALTSAIGFSVLRIASDVLALQAQRNGTFEAPGPWVDWQTYVNAFDRAVHGLGIYAPAQLDGPYLLTHVVLTGYAYPPPSVLLFAPFASYPFGLIAWLTLNLALFFSAIWALVSRAWRPYRVLLIAGVIAWLTFYFPFTDGVESANVNVGLAGIIGWIALGLRPSWLGICGAAGTLTKIFPGAVAAAGAREKVRSIAIAITIVAIAAVLTLPVVGLGAWSDFIRALSGAVPDCYGENLSVACSLQSFVGIGAGTAIGVAAGATAALGLLLVRDKFWLAVLASVAVMAPVTNLHPHYWLVIPVLLIASILKWKAMRSQSAIETGKGRPPDVRSTRPPPHISS